MYKLCALHVKSFFKSKALKRKTSLTFRFQTHCDRIRRPGSGSTHGPFVSTAIAPEIVHRAHRQLRAVRNAPVRNQTDLFLRINTSRRSYPITFVHKMSTTMCKNGQQKIDKETATLSEPGLSPLSTSIPLKKIFILFKQHKKIRKKQNFGQKSFLKREKEEKIDPEGAQNLE